MTQRTANSAGSALIFVRISCFYADPVKYTDPDGRSLDELLGDAQKSFEEYVTKFIEDNKDVINASSGRVTLGLGEVQNERFTLSGNVFIEATGEEKIRIQIEGAVDFSIAGDKIGGAEAMLKVGLRLGYTVAESSKDNFGIKLSPENVSSLDLAIDATIKLGDGIGVNGHLRKYLHNFNSSFSWKDLAAKNWIVGGQANFRNARIAGRFNISKWLGYDK
jgi:hypothetical protein